MAHAELSCSHCNGPAERRVVHYRHETVQPMVGDGYGWDRVVITDAAVFCSPECLAQWLSQKLEGRVA